MSSQGLKPKVFTEFPPDSWCVVPAAGPVPEGLASVASVATISMLPLGGKPVIHWQIEYLLEQGLTRFRIGVPGRGLAVETYVEHVFGDRIEIEWIDCRDTGSVAGSVDKLCTGIDGPVLVVMGDTVFKFGDSTPPVDHPWLLTASVENPHRWCVVSKGDGGEVLQWYEKMDNPPCNDAAVGVYWIPKWSEVSMNKVRDLPAQEISHIMCSISENQRVLAVDVGEWFDCGHSDTYETSKMLALAERSFNSIRVETVMGILHKRSENKIKLIDEINYLRLLPIELKPLYPQVFDFSVDASSPWIEMEYFGYQTLTELFLYHHLQPTVWERILQRLALLLERMKGIAYPVSNRAMQLMYIDKTFDRLDDAKRSPRLRYLLGKETLVLNGVEIPNVFSLKDEICQTAQSIEPSGIGSVVHGDFCFSNILFDVRTSVCRLIDPRGSFGNSGIYGDHRYDIAKLHHSLVGLYDHVVAGQFKLNVNDHEIGIHIPRTQLQAQVEDRYRTLILKNYNPNEIDFLTGLIFLSLLPLHSESSDRQIAFFARGIELLINGMTGIRDNANLLRS